MTTYYGGSCDVAVIGAGHAGIEAGLAAARLGCKTAVFGTVCGTWIHDQMCRTDLSEGKDGKHKAY